MSTHHRTVHVLSISNGQAIRKSRSEEYLPSSHKAEENLELRRGTVAIKTIPSFSKLGEDLRIRFESKQHREAKERAEECSREKEKETESRWKLRRERDTQEIERRQKDSLHCRVATEPSVTVKMSLVQTSSPVKAVNDLKEAREAIKKLNESLLNEKRLSEAKDTTIGNLRHEISLLDQELVDKRKENDKCNEEMRKLRSKTTSLQTENKILERQVKMMNESNKNLHNELHELRNKLRIQEAKVGELRVQRSDAVRKYAHLLQTSVDKSTRLRYFLQQLQNEILAHSVTAKKFEMQKQALEDLMQEDSQEDLQFKKYGLISPRKIKRASYSLSEDEKESLRKDIESAFEGRHSKVQDRSFPIEKLTTATERMVTESLKSRLGQENEGSLQMSKLMQEAKHQIKNLDKIESSHAEASKRLEDKVGTQLKALETELKDLSDELRHAQISKREDEEKLRSIRKFSSADVKVESINLARRASQVEKLDLESAINSMERRSEDTTSPMSPRDIEILQMKQKMAAIIEEKLMLSDELIESRTSLSNLESLLDSRSLENEKMEKELSDKEKRISLTEERLKEAYTETTNLKEELETAKNELSSREREEIAAQSEVKPKDRPHRVELNFTPNIQPAHEQRVEHVEKSSDKEIATVSPMGVDKGVQVESEPRKRERLRSWESPRSARRRLSLQTDEYGQFEHKLERKVSKTLYQVKLVQRSEKGVQVKIGEELSNAPKTSNDDQVLRVTLAKENQELKAILEQQNQDIASLENEIAKLQGDKKNSDLNGEDDAPFNYPKRVSELWKAVEEARQEKAKADKRNKELQDELNKQEQEIQVMINNLKGEPEVMLPPEEKDSFKTDMPNHNNNYVKENQNLDAPQGQTLEELISASKTSRLDHEFVFDTEDGQRILNEGRLKVRGGNEEDILMLESVIDRLRNDLRASEEQCKELKTELYRKQDELHKAESEIESHKNELTEMKASLDKTNEGIDCAGEEVVLYKAQVTELNDLLKDTRKEKVRVEEEAEKCRLEIKELKASLGQARKESGLVENNIELYKSQITELKSTLDETTRENEKSATEIIQCNSHIEYLENSLEDARKGVQKADKEIEINKSEISQLKKLLGETKIEKQKANEISERSKLKISELEATLDGSKKELSSTRKEIEQHKSEILQLKSNLEKTQGENRKAIDEKEQYKSKIPILEASLEKTRKENISAVEEIRKNKNEIIELKSMLDKRRLENERATSDVNRYKSQGEDLKVSLDDARKESNRYKDQISDLKASLGRSRKESANVTKEYELYKFEISDLQNSLEEEREENRAAKKTIERSKSELSDLKKSLEKEKEDIEKYKSQISDLQASLEEKRQENVEATNNFEKYEVENSTLQKLLDEAKAENSTLKSGIEQYKTQIADLQASLEEEKKENLAAAKEIVKYEAEISDLKYSFEKSKQETSTANNNVKSYENQLSDIQAELEETVKEKCRRESQAVELESEIIKIGEIVEKYKMKEAETRLEKERLETGNSKLQITIDNLKTQLMGADKKVKDLEGRAEEDNKTISQLMEEQSGIGRLEEQIKVLEAKLSVRDKNLEKKVEDIIERDNRIEEITQERDELEKKLQEISNQHQEESLQFDTVDGQPTETVQAQNLSENDLQLSENPEIIEDLGNDVLALKEQLESLQTALKEIQQEKAGLEDRVQELTSLKSSQEKELDLLRQQIQFLESSVQDTEKNLEKNVQKMEEKEKELRELVNERVVKTTEIASLEASLGTALRERDVNLAAKEDSIERLQTENGRLGTEIEQLKMEVQKQAFDWQQKSKMDADFAGVADKLKETELKYLLTKEEKEKVEKDLKNSTERMITLQKCLSDAQATIKVKEEKIKQLTAENFELRSLVKDKDESICREEKLRMENMKSLDALKIKLEKMGTDEKKQRERLFSLKSACSEANEAYEIVKKQNYEMKRDMENVKKRLSEKDSALEISEKEKEKMEEQILNASRTIDDLRKSFRRDESVSPDSALGVSLTSASGFEFNSGPSSPNSVASDNAFSGDSFGQETGLLCKMPTMIENFRAVVRDNEALRGKLYEVTLHKEKQDAQVKHLSQLNEILKNDAVVKDKSVLGLEDKVKVLESESRDAKSKVVELERSYAVVSSQADLLKTTLENREKDFVELHEKIELQEEKEKTLELYSKSVAEKFEYETSEKKKYEDLSRQLLEESTKQKNQLQSIEKKLSVLPSDRDDMFSSAQESVPMATVEDKVGMVLKKKKDLEVLVSNLQAECADLQLANGVLQKDLTQYLESEKQRQELEGELKVKRIRDEQTNAKVIYLEEQKKSLQNENKSLEAAIVETKKQEEKLAIKTGAMKQTILELEKANENFQGENEHLKDNLRRADEESSKLANELKSFQAKMAEIETTNDAFQVENEKLRTDIMALTSAKCDVEFTISEAERQIKKLSESADKEKLDREVTEVQKNEALNHCEALQHELNRAKERVVSLEEKQTEADKLIEEMEKNKFDSSSENRRLAEELQLVKKDLSEMEQRCKKSIQEEENLQQKLNLANLEFAKLTTSHEGSLKRNDSMEKSLVESKGKNEELEILLEKTRLEKANVLRDVSQKDEVIQQLEAKKHELEEERQSLTNDLYVATRKVLAQQQNAEALMTEINHVNREMKGAIKNALSRSTEEEKPSQGESSTVGTDNEVLLQNLHQSIRVTERNLDFFRSEAKISEHETKNCQRDVEFINKEFSLLSSQLSSFSTTSHKLCEEIKKLKDDLAQKEGLLEETKGKHDSLKEENLENRESIIQLQNKCTELEALFGEYENKAEKQHTELVRTNQQISTLDSNLLRAEQKKNVLEKELLVCHEKIFHLEGNVRAMKDEGRNDKKKIATLETEYSEKQALARELENTEATFRELRGKFDDVLREKEEAKTELYGMREEMRQQQVELKSARKEVENLKKQMNSEKDTRQKVELDLNENAAVCKTYKNNLQDMERSLGRLREENSDLEEKVSILETNGNTLRKETELQAIEMKRLEEELAEMREHYTNLCKNHEGSEKERKKLVNEMIIAEEKITKLQGTCDELLKEKETNSSKVLSLNEALEVIISSNEETAANLKTDLLNAKKDLSVTKSALERRQKLVEELQEELKNDELKIKSLEDKKQEVFEKYWTSQNDLTEAEGTIDNLRDENKELKEQCASSAQRIQHLQDTLQSERETNEKEVSAWSDQMNKLKSLHQKVIEERGNLKRDLEHTQASLTKSEDDLKQTSEVLTEKERVFNDDVTKRDHALEDLSMQNANLTNELTKTKESLAKTCSENEDLKERLDLTSEKVEWLEKELQERNTEIEDLLAEAQAKMNVVRKMKATNSGEHFAELPSSDFMARDSDEEEGTDGVDARPVTPMNTSMKDVVDSFHKACLSSFNDNRGLQQELSAKSDEIARLDESLQKEKNNASEMKRYLHDLEKKKGKLEDDVKRLRRRLEALKLKSVEMEKGKDNEITETKGEKILLEKELWDTKEALEETKAKLKSSGEEKERYAKDLESSRKQIVDAKCEIKGSQQQLDTLQENILQLKRRTFELEANERAAQQLIQEKDRELFANQSKIKELEKLYDNANEKKTELFTKLSRADERIASLENDCQSKTAEKGNLENEITALTDNVKDKSTKLQRTEEDLNDSREKCDELEIQRGSLQATNEILKHQLDGTKKECSQLQALLQKEKELCNALSGQLNDVKSEKENLNRELKGVVDQKDHIQQLLNTSEASLNTAENSVVSSFHEIENLKRQMVKVQGGACADSARKQLEIGKLRAEAESLKKELNEKEREHNENLTKFKVTEKENQFLKRDLAEKHSRESELKLDLTSTNSKLQSYVIERECWEREVKSVLSEMEQQKNASVTKEERLERMRTRYEKEIKFLQERVEALEREVRIIQEASEQQRHADEIACKLALESKDMEIDNLKLRLQATRMHTSEKSDVLEIMKDQLDERTRQIADLMEQLRMLKESYHLELGSLHADLKCAQMENMLHKGGELSGSFGARQETELLEAIRQSRKESERLRNLLRNKMKDMKSLRKHILSERVSAAKRPGYTMY